MDEIKCLSCGETLNIPQVINTSKYDGQLVCQKCSALLHVKLVKDKLEKYDKVKEGSHEPITHMVFVLPDGTKVVPGRLRITEGENGEES